MNPSMNDTITIPLPITTKFIKEHPDWIFVYSGATKVESHHGQGAVCWECDNATDAPVRWSMCKSNGYFNDNQFDDIKFEIDMRMDAINRLFKGSIIVVFPKIGLGDSRMREYAPKAHAYLMEQLRDIAYPHIKWEVKESQTENGNVIDTNLI